MTISLRDFQHASKIFRSDSYAKAPKLKFLFHAYFALNDTQYSNGTIGTLTNQEPIGVLVKTFKLPSFQLMTHEMNQYNRKRVVQTKIKYEPVEISFHDDSSNIITKLWNEYYTYYYNDSKNYINSQFQGKPGYVPPQFATESLTGSRNIYENEISENSSWGYIGETNTSSSIKKAFFRYITIFGFNQHKFTAYTLVNPIITRVTHDTYNYSEGGGTMEMTMSINYETVIYNQGAMDGKNPSNIVTQFGQDNIYDRVLSPITQPDQVSLVNENAGLVNANGGFINTAQGSSLTSTNNVFDVL
jgi:hypothetical protein